MCKLIPGDLVRLNADIFASLLLAKEARIVISSNMSAGEVRSDETLIVIAITTGDHYAYVLGQRHGWINTDYLTKINNDAPR